MYHAFGAPPGGADPYDLFLPMANLEQQLDLLLQGGWRALDLDDYLTALDTGSGTGSFHVTIDDGFAAVPQLAAPALAARGVPSTLFVLPGLVGGTSAWLDQMPDAPMASADELAALPAQGMTLGVHGHDHTAVTGLGPDDLDRQTRQARDAVTTLAGAVPRAFAYPFGWHDEPARAAVRDAGFDIGFSLYDDVGRHAVSRADVKPTDGLATFCAKLIPAYRRVWQAAGRVGPIRRALRTISDKVVPENHRSGYYE
jgi:peptidoglycan/xylan/chitin deacetylase (PgdA/CDA1 family)